MKGKAQLILTDPDSGRVIKHIEESNMVTNAIQRIFDIPRQAILRSNTSDIYNGFLPFYKYLMSGLVMLGNNVEENPDKFMIPDDSIFVGSAGTTYTGSTRSRGSLNTNQSCEIDGGYRFVWDFAPEKAIGTIRCIGLTNYWFGNAAFTHEKQNGIILLNPLNIANAEQYTGIECFSVKGMVLGFLDGGQTLYSVYARGSTATIYRYRVPDYNALRIYEKISDFRNLEIVRKDEYSLPLSMNDYRCFAFDKTSGWGYFFNTSYSSSAKIEKVKFCAMDIRTGEIKREGNFSWSPKSHASYTYFAVRDNKIYIAEYGDLRVLSMSGEQLEEYDLGNVNSAIPFFLNGKMFAIAADSNSSYLCNFKHDPITFIRSTSHLQSTDYVSLPYILISSFSNNETITSYIMLRTDYLATINNLSEPLVKTDRHALQVRYEITDK